MVQSKNDLLLNNPQMPNLKLNNYYTRMPFLNKIVFSWFALTHAYQLLFLDHTMTWQIFLLMHNGQPSQVSDLNTGLIWVGKRNKFERCLKLNEEYNLNKTLFQHFNSNWFSFNKIKTLNYEQPLKKLKYHLQYQFC